MELLAQTKQTAENSANLFEAFTLATRLTEDAGVTVLLLPLLGAAIPLAIMLWAMIALSKKGQGTAPHS